ncbi:MAG: HD domain-containing phosphohydrolase [Candidatus Brocadiaceae bacterium]
MAEHQQFFPISLAVMQPGTLAPVDLYIRVPGATSYTLYRSARTPLTEEIRQRLLDRGVNALHLRSEDKDAYYGYVEEHIQQIVRDELLPLEEACSLVYESSTRVMKEVFEDPRSGKSIQRAERMVDATVLAIMKEPDALWYMTAMASHDYYTYTHSVNVCVFLIAATRELLDVDSTSRLRQIGLGGLLHDIGKSRVPGDILSKPGPLSEEEFDMVKQHPLAGLEIVEQVRSLPLEPTSIIRSHHERLDGSGYPDGLSGEAIAWLPRLAGIIDTYDALTTKRSYAAVRTPFEALQLMLSEGEDRLDLDLLHRFVKFLGPDELSAGNSRSDRKLAGI